MNHLVYRPDLRCPNPGCRQSFLVEYRVTDFVSTFVCKQHGDIVPIMRYGYLPSVENRLVK